MQATNKHRNMKNNATLLITIILMCLCSIGAAAQDNGRRPGKDVQDRWKAEKIAFLTDAMELTSAEAEKFWPVYNQSEAMRRENWKQVTTAYKDLQEAIDAGKDEKEISALLDKYVKVQQEGRDLDTKFISEYKKILPARKVAQLYIGEESFRRLQIHKLNKNDKN